VAHGIHHQLWTRDARLADAARALGVIAIVPTIN
jgi:predicted nucleic acid-binding protein